MSWFLPSLKKPWLWLPPTLAHELAPLALQIQSAFCEQKIPVWKPLEWQGLKFPNRLGIAGGVDKDAELVEEWWKQGAGFIEVGTITPHAQAPNPGKIMDRDLAAGALWNRMGFPGSGVHAVCANLRDLKRPYATPLFANIGKNRATPNQDAALDYTTCLRELAPLVDGFVINISSPNTVGLRELLQPSHLKKFLGALVEARDTHATQTPLLLKLSPDMSESELEAVVDTALKLGITGLIATNTTLSREPTSRFPNEGGVSGKPLAEKSKAALKRIRSLLNDEHLLISAGGVMTPEDVFERLHLGADLVQIYTVLIFEGPWFFKQVARKSQEALLGTCPLTTPYNS